MSSETVPDDLTNLSGEAPLSLTRLPVIKDLGIVYLTSLLIVLLTGAASIAGLLRPNDIYPTEELRQLFVANDVVNLVIGLPILLASMWLTQHGKLIGLLFWPGALFYGLYNYAVYLFAMPLNGIFLLYLIIVTLNIYTTIGLVASIQGKQVKNRLLGRVPEKFASGILIGFGLLFMARALIVMVEAIASQTAISRPELALLLVDFLFSPVWVIGGVLLWRRQALGYVGGTGLLFQASMLFIGLIAVLIIQPFLTEASFALTDVIVVLIMGLICFIPFVLFIKGVIKS
jgi:hypothetical protein